MSDDPWNQRILSFEAEDVDATACRKIITDKQGDEGVKSGIVSDVKKRDGDGGIEMKEVGAVLTEEHLKTGHDGKSEHYYHYYYYYH